MRHLKELKNCERNWCGKCNINEKDTGQLLDKMREFRPG
jgi:hypothetical protein